MKGPPESNTPQLAYARNLLQYLCFQGCKTEEGFAPYWKHQNKKQQVTHNFPSRRFQFPGRRESHKRRCVTFSFMCYPRIWERNSNPLVTPCFQLFHRNPYFFKNKLFIVKKVLGSRSEGRVNRLYGSEPYCLQTQEGNSTLFPSWFAFGKLWRGEMKWQQQYHTRMASLTMFFMAFRNRKLASW